LKDFRDQFDLTGRLAAVTGASEGIGRDLALGLAWAGADVIVCSRREQQLKEVKAEIEKIGRKSEIFIMDVCKLGDIEGLKNFIMERFGKVDILVNSAGFSISKPTWDITEKDWDQMIDVGLKGTFFCCQIIGSIMKDRGYGKIINLSSTFSRCNMKNGSVYATLKAGVSHLTETLAVEWAPQGIRVNAIAPTAISTPSRAERLKGENLQRVVSRIPLGRLATGEDLLGAANYLASPASDFVTGHTLFVDGGWVAAG